MFLGAYVEKTLGHRNMHVWSGECHVHAGIRPVDITRVRDEHPGSDFLIHPECGCVTSVMEYVAAGDVDAEGVHMLSTGGMQHYAEEAERDHAGETVIVATETGMLYPMRKAAPDVNFIAANEAATCRYMKMITLPKLRDTLRDGSNEVKVPQDDRRSRARPDRAHGLDQRLRARRTGHPVGKSGDPCRSSRRGSVRGDTRSPSNLGGLTELPELRSSAR